jgi:hypothetical protein
MLEAAVSHAITLALVLSRSLTVAKTVALLVVLGSEAIPKRPHFGGGDMAGGKLRDKAIKNAKPGDRLVILSDGRRPAIVAGANRRKALECSSLLSHHPAVRYELS